MYQTNSYEVVVRNSASAVMVPLNDGICSLNRVYEGLIGADVHPFTGYCSNYDYIRQQIKQAWGSLQKSDQAATTCLRNLDGYLATLTQDEGKFEQQKRTTEETLGNLRTIQASDEKLLNKSQRALEQAETHLWSTRATLRRQERRAENATVLTGLGLGLSLIPRVGWVLGAPLVIGSVIEASEASRGIKIAEEELKKFKNQVDMYTGKVCDHESKISQTKFNISEIDHKLTQIRKDIHMVRKQRHQVGGLQWKMRSAVHLLSVLSGKVNVLEKQTRKCILQEAVMKVMEEVMKSTEELAGNELFCNQSMLRLVEKMRENSRHLRAICASQNSNQNDSCSTFNIFFMCQNTTNNH